ncbi:hypothetical protein AYI68_g8192 [Smittium mucronatum]|uniref:RRM domain-containing protein n=1 Tax=Smittium mucronatum TaxID=133383 RepID=A0A1R0GLJ7_9FUNG|nr:hypothetical protein AYI68_g8192 [Smittium mucronatum]
MRKGRGLFDFIYLRIDWSTNRNSGFGFIHFCDKLSMGTSHGKCLLYLCVCMIRRKCACSHTPRSKICLNSCIDSIPTGKMKSSLWEHQPSCFYTTGEYTGLEIVPYWILCDL